MDIEPSIIGPSDEQIDTLAAAIAKSEGLDWAERCGTLVEEVWDCDSSTCIAAGFEDHDPEDARAYYRRLAKVALTERLHPDAIVKTLGAAVMALRSYQYGNAAPDLAKEAADAGEEALRAIGFPPGFMATEGAR